MITNLDPREVAEVNKQKGEFAEKSVEAQKTATPCLKLWSDFQKNRSCHSGDFGFQFSDPKNSI